MIYHRKIKRKESSVISVCVCVFANNMTNKQSDGEDFLCVFGCCLVDVCVGECERAKSISRR